MSINFFGNNSLDKLISLIKSKFDNVLHKKGSSEPPSATEVRDCDTIKGHPLSDFVLLGSDPLEPLVPVMPRNADRLEGHKASYFTTRAYTDEKLNTNIIYNANGLLIYEKLNVVYFETREFCSSEIFNSITLPMNLRPSENIAIPGNYYTTTEYITGNLQITTAGKLNFADAKMVNVDTDYIHINGHFLVI